MKHLYKYFPTPSDKMGYFWSISSIKDASVIEYGPAGTTHYAIEGISKINGEIVANVFTTDMNQDDVIMGDISKLKKAILEVDKVYKHKYIFVVASSLSSMIGSDIQGLIFEIQEEVSARIISHSSGGFKGDYLHGIEQSYLDIAKYIVKPTDKKTETFNIIGSGMFQHNYRANTKAVASVIQNSFGINLNSSFTNGASIENIERFLEAKINVVTDVSGIKCAEYLKEKHNIDYVYVTPVGYNNTFDMINKLSEKLNVKADEKYFNEIKEKSKSVLMQMKYVQKLIKNKDIVLSGDYSVVRGYHSFLENELGLFAKSVLVNHSKMDISEDDGRYIFSVSESDKREAVQANEPGFVIGDAVLIKIANEINKGNKMKCIQIGNPNIDKKILTDHMPSVCFQGADYVIEEIVNFTLRD